ncbi:hypothetical protein LXL04_003816 [Taraxacum kok-saghyz]
MSDAKCLLPATGNTNNSKNGDEQHSSIQPVPNLPYSKSLPLRRTSSSSRRPWQFTTLEKKKGRFESVAHLYLDSRSCGLVSSSSDAAWHRWVFGVAPGNKENGGSLVC